MNLPEQQKNIGVFDSGIGGLTVVRALMKRLPFENIIYFGDTARVPYGSKSAEVVREYAFEDMQFLIQHGVKLIVVACNTVSAIAIDDLHSRFSVPIVGMIQPGASAAAFTSQSGRIGVIGTLATITSESYKTALKLLDNRFSVFSRACPLFVPLAEEGWYDHPVSQMVANEYLSEFQQRSIDTLIMGCTHYPILRSVIQNAVGQNVHLIDSGAVAAEEVEKFLRSHKLLNPIRDKPNYKYYVSDVPQRFKQLGSIFLDDPDILVHRVRLP